MCSGSSSYAVKFVMDLQDGFNGCHVYATLTCMRPDQVQVADHTGCIGLSLPSKQLTGAFEFPAPVPTGVKLSGITVSGGVVVEVEDILHFVNLPLICDLVKCCLQSQEW